MKFKINEQGISDIELIKEQTGEGNIFKMKFYFNKAEKAEDIYIKTEKYLRKVAPDMENIQHNFKVERDRNVFILLHNIAEGLSILSGTFLDKNLCKKIERFVCDQDEIEAKRIWDESKTIKLSRNQSEEDIFADATLTLLDQLETCNEETRDRYIQILSSGLSKCGLSIVKTEKDEPRRTPPIQGH